MDKECCGVNSYTEWMSLSNGANSSTLFPQSCLCPNTYSTCTNVSIYSNQSAFMFATLSTSTTTNENSSLIHSTQCGDVIMEDLKEVLTIVRIVGPVVAFIELLFVFMILYVLHHIDNRSLVGSYVVSNQNQGEAQNQIHNENVTTLL